MGRRNKCKAKIRTWDDPILKQACEPVEVGEDVWPIVRDMLFILTNDKTGVGLAAPQAGHTKRIIIISLNGFPQVMINPELIEHMENTSTRKEGCLSYPGRFVEVERWANILIKYDTEKGGFGETRLINWPARIFQHELDHLDGICKVYPQAKENQNDN